MRTALITGANRGLGNALAFAFADKGYYDLILHSRHKKDFQKPSSAVCDVVTGDLHMMETIFEIKDVVNSHGGISVLVNNAGIYHRSKFSDTSIAEIVDVISVNLLAPMILTEVLWDELLRSDTPVIININSIAGQQGSPNEALYCASKHGLKGFSDSIQFDGTSAGIRVINVCIGAMRTDMSKDKEDHDKFIEPKDAARTIVDVCETDFGSLRIPEITIARNIYK